MLKTILDITTLAARRTSSFGTIIRHGEMKRGAAELGALGPDLAAVQLHELLADGEAEPDSARRASRNGHLPERVEDPRQLGRGIPSAGVGDAHLHSARRRARA